KARAAIGALVVRRRIQRIEVLRSLVEWVLANYDAAKVVAREHVRHPWCATEVEPGARGSRRLVEVRGVIDRLAVIGIDIGADAIAEPLIDVDAGRIAREPGQELHRAFLDEIRDAGVDARAPGLAAHVDVTVLV